MPFRPSIYLRCSGANIEKIALQQTPGTFFLKSQKEPLRSGNQKLIINQEANRLKFSLISRQIFH